MKAADAFEDAAAAVADYQAVLAEQQARYERAKTDLERAEAASEAARERHNAQVEAFNASDRTGPRPGEFVDPAAGDIAAARREMQQAKAAVEEADRRAAAAVRAAAVEAPAEPGFFDRLGRSLGDLAQSTGRAVGSFAAGAGGAVVELGKLARLVAPLDPWKFSHPGEAQEAASTVAAGLVGAVQNPYAAVKTVVDPDGWRQDPAKNLGAMVPDALASLAGGAGVAGRVARGIGKLSKASRVARHADDLPTGTPAAHSPGTPGPQQPGTSHTPWQNDPPPTSRGYGVNTDPVRPPEPTPTRPEASSSPGVGTYERLADELGDGEGSGSLGRGDGSALHGGTTPEHGPPDGGLPDPPGHHSQPDHPDTARLPSEDYSGNRDFAATPEDHQAMREIIGDNAGQQRLLDELRSSNPGLSHIPDEELVGMQRYTGIHHQDWNEALRAGDPDRLAKHDIEIRNAVSGMNKLPDWTPEPGQELYRGIDLPPEKLPELLERYQSGKVVEESAFTSADKANPFPGNVQFVFNEPRHAKDLEFLNPYGGMREAGWPPGQKFVVDRVVPDETGQTWTIHMIETD